MMRAWWIHGRQWLPAAVLLVTLAAGLYPRDYRFRNGARWLKEGPGLAFEGHGAAITPPFITGGLADQCASEGFTLELAVSNTHRGPKGFGFIAQFHSGKEQSQLLLGQWKEWLIVMNGDDYVYRRGIPRISVKLPGDSPTTHLVTVTSAAAGTRLFLNGQLAGESSDVVLRMPQAPHNARLILGNAANGKHPWRGSIRGFAFNLRTPDSETVSQRFLQWRQTGDFGSPNYGPLQLLYTFNENGGGEVRDHSPYRTSLHIPEWDIVVEKQLLGFPPNGLRFNASLLGDFLVNLFGFLPAGATMASLLRRRGAGCIYTALVATAAAAALSFGIEATQMWLPSRDSSLLDFVLNTLGGLLGAVAWCCHQHLTARPAGDRDRR